MPCARFQKRHLSIVSERILIYVLRRRQALLSLSFRTARKNPKRSGQRTIAKKKALIYMGL